MSGAQPGVVKYVRREQLALSTEATVKGLLATYTNAKRLPIEGEIIAAELAQMVRAYVDNETADFRSRMARSAEKISLPQ